MNKIENDFNSQFKRIKESVKLSETEMDFHRGEVLKFIDQKPSPYFHKKIQSPFYFGFFLKKHFVVTSLAIVLIFSGGLTISADNSLPNNYLYQVKTKITEPILVFLTPNSKAKAFLKVSLVERRLQEYSQVTFNGEILSPEDKTSFINQFSSQVKDAHQGISKLVEEENLPDALETTNDLQSILSAQDIILEKIHEVNPDAENTDEVILVIIDSIESTTTIENNITETVQISIDETDIENSINSQKEEITESLKNLKEGKQLDVPGEEGMKNLDVVNQAHIDSKIFEITISLDEANTKSENGDKKEALEMYNQIDQDLGELESLIRSEQKLEVDDLDKSIGPKDKINGDSSLPIDLENTPTQE